MGYHNAQEEQIQKENELNATVTLSSDQLEAYLTLFPSNKNRVVTEEEIIKILHNHGIVYGLLENRIQQIVENKIYFREILIAKGLNPIDGVDGKFNFYFNTKIDKKPKMMEDGSVDYRTIKLFESVSEGQVIAKYQNVSKGINGKDVKGNVILARNGRELPVLKGTNFTLLDDQCTYISNVNGKIEIINDRIIITDVYELKGDINITTGNVDFNGDIFINGNIEKAMTVKATGNIIVKGYVEASYLYAGGDIILSNGMQGGGKGKIEAGGNVSGKFFEQVNIKADGSVNANTIMNCYIEAKEEVNVSGRYGIIIGGYIHALRRITAYHIGNSSELKTILSVGISKQDYDEIKLLKLRVNEIKKELFRIEETLQKLTEYLLKPSNSSELLKKRNLLVQTKIVKKKEYEILEQEIEKKVQFVRRANGANINIYRYVYPGTKIIINTEVLYITERQRNLTFKRNGIEIEMYPNSK